MSTFSEARANFERAARQRSASEREVAAARAALKQLELRLTELARIGDIAGSDAVRAERDRIANVLAAARTRLAVIAVEHDAAHAVLVDGRDPRRVIGELDDRIPIVLVPLRLETRFVADEIWIRAFPDALAIQSHEPALTGEEIVRGKAYWTSIHRGGDAVAAWNRLAAGGAVSRALWIVRATRPTNQPPADPAFPVIAEKPSSWSQAPRVELMPEQLVFELYAEGRLVHAAVGARIPSPLIVGPEPDGSLDRGPDGALVVDDAMQWLVDFDAAIRSGMAVRIALGDGPQAFDRLVVAGVRLATSELEGARQLEQLLEAHRYSDGLQFVRQGMPTNHTEDAAAGDVVETAEAAIARELGSALFDATTDPVVRSDGARLANALGISETALDHVLGADRRDVGEAVAMNRALWPATLGYFAEQMMSSSVDHALRDEARRLFTRFVFGRGSLPALQIARQPYGMIATTAFSRWQPFPGESPQLATIDATLGKLASTWTSLAERVVRAGTGADPAHSLINILGLQASSVSFHQRRLLGPEYLWNVVAFEGGDPRVRRQAHAEAARALVRDLDLQLAGHPRILDLQLFTEYRTLTRALVDDEPLSEVRGLDPNYIEWLRGNLDQVRDESFGAPVPRTLLYLLLRRAVLLGAWDASMEELVARGLVSATARMQSEVVNVRHDGEPTPWDHLDAKIAGARHDLSVGEFVRGNSAQYREQLRALAVLAPLPTARLERLLSEHIDLCSFRLDAWRLGRVAQRLDAIRETRREGVYVGMYGWLESIRRAGAAETPGFIHAPSLAHATAAAILRSGYDSHDDAASRERMAVDLSSERVRRALTYLEGLREGQSLAALLGFRFERGLHDANPTLALEQFLVLLRQAFPMTAGRVVASAGESIDSVQARDVVDGTRLLQARSRGYPYGVSGLPATDSTTGRAIAAEVDKVASDMDAIADLVLAESVFQAAQGKQERANAFANSLATGAPLPAPEIAATPRSGTAVTHRLCLVFGHEVTATPWPGSTPRSRFEPDLDRWLGRVLGDPATIRVRVVADGIVQDVSFDLIGMQPIDLVVICADGADGMPASLARRIERFARSRAGLAADAPVELRWDERDPAWPASVRTLFELMPLVTALASMLQGRPLGAGDLAAEGAEANHDLAELSARLAASLAELEGGSTPAAVEAWLQGSALAERVESTVDDLEALHATATSALASAATLSALTSVAKLMFGAGFTPLPRFVAANPTELTNAVGAPALLADVSPRAVDEWIADVARVRPRVAGYENVRMLSDLLGGGLGPTALAQVPFDASARWLGLDLTAASPRDGRALSLVLHVASMLDPAAPLCGVVIDELVDVIPAAAEVTGVAIRHDRPRSEPPQAVLVVIPTALRGGWQWADVVGAVRDTLDLAKTRLVEPALVSTTGYAQFLPAVIGPVADNPVTITLDLQRLA